MERVSLEFGYGIDIGLMLEKHFNDIIMSLVASIMNWTPLIQSLIVDHNWVSFVSIFNNVFGFIVHASLTIIPQLFIIFGDFFPKTIPSSLIRRAADS